MWQRHCPSFVDLKMVLSFVEVDLMTVRIMLNFLKFCLSKVKRSLWIDRGSMLMSIIFGLLGVKLCACCSRLNAFVL